MPLPNKLLANPIVVFREEFDDWSIVFDPDQGLALGLNPVGALVWKLFDGTRTIAEILETLAKDFDEVPPEAERELEEFVEDLVRRGFVGYVVEEV